MILTGPGHRYALNEHGEVNWTMDEMIVLTDEEALALMELHRCV